MSVETIKWVKGSARIIDQTKLPNKFEYIYCRDVKTMWQAIKRLSVRGAPAIGVAAAFGVLLGVQKFKGNDKAKFLRLFHKTCDYLATSRPTAVNLFNMLNQMRTVIVCNPKADVASLKKLLFLQAMIIFKADQVVCRRMGDHGAKLIKNKMQCLTVCNAGALATVDYGTALGVFYSAKRQGKKFSVYSLETRPLLQGSRLTCWELLRQKIDTTLICDNMAASLMAKSKVDIIFTGADRIASNGDTANKIGTYMLAVLAKHHGIPFYIVAPRSTFDLKIKSGKQIPIEERKSEEVTHFAGVSTAPKGIKVYNPAFDVTPANLITGIVTEYGIIRPPYIKNIHAYLSQLGEFGLIDVLKKFAPVSKSVIKGIGDDAAVLPYSKKEYLLLTTDMLAEDTHFTRRMPPQSIGHKALACSISDIAAMGGLPTFAVVSIGIPKNLPVRFIKDVYKGMQLAARAFNVSIVGGDTIKTDKIVINVALLGLVEKKYLTTRDGARVGDWIFVTGPLGGSFKSGRHLNFLPRLPQARFLVENYSPSAMMDISDGLSGDLNHILKASRVGAHLEYSSIPRHKGVSLSQALNDGEDFELVFTLSPKKARSLMDWQAGKRAFYFYPMGTITPHAKEKINGPKSFTHF